VIKLHRECSHPIPGGPTNPPPTRLGGGLLAILPAEMGLGGEFGVVVDRWSGCG
jgi:hypothetical protein